MNMNIMKKAKVILESIDGSSATLKSDGRSFEIPQDMLPGRVEVGDNLFIEIKDEHTELQDQESLAKEVLNEVLKEE